jgi:hypothetical protein
MILIGHKAFDQLFRMVHLTKILTFWDMEPYNPRPTNCDLFVGCSTTPTPGNVSECTRWCNANQIFNGVVMLVMAVCLGTCQEIF